MTVQQTLAELVAINSVSAGTNAAIIAYLEDRCRALNLLVTKFPYTDDRGVEKVNLVAQSSAGNAVELALVGHTDTVPIDQTWTEALNLTEKEGKLFGRGACDTKAFIACALTAIGSVDLKELKKPLALVFTADEEIGCIGAKRLAAANPFQVRFAIVGEPTSLQPINAGKGYCLAEIAVHGREAHSAYPDLGASAIFGAARLIARIEKIAGELKGDSCAEFDPPYTTLNVGLINGGSAKNIVAGECHFTLEWRSVPGQATAHVLNLVNQAVADPKTLDPNLNCEVRAARADESFETAAESRLVKFLTDASGRVSATIAFGTEAPTMIALGAEAVVFGPGDIRVAHRTGEFVRIDELDSCVAILGQAIQHFCL
jgi:acetylornithine deacetylase